MEDRYKSFLKKISDLEIELKAKEFAIKEETSRCQESEALHKNLQEEIKKIDKEIERLVETQSREQATLDNLIQTRVQLTSLIPTRNEENHTSLMLLQQLEANYQREQENAAEEYKQYLRSVNRHIRYFRACDSSTNDSSVVGVDEALLNEPIDELRTDFEKAAVFVDVLKKPNEEQNNEEDIKHKISQHQKNIQDLNDFFASLEKENHIVDEKGNTLNASSTDTKDLEAINAALQRRLTSLEAQQKSDHSSSTSQNQE